MKEMQRKNQIRNIIKKNFSVIWQFKYERLFIKIFVDDENFDPQFICLVCNEYYTKHKSVRNKYQNS